MFHLYRKLQQSAMESHLPAPAFAAKLAPSSLLVVPVVPPVCVRGFSETVLWRVPCVLGNRNRISSLPLRSDLLLYFSQQVPVVQESLPDAYRLRN